MCAMRLVILESPYAGDVARHVEYARACLADCLHRGEAPMASHLLYTQPGVLDDDKPAERAQGIKAGLAWGQAADAAVFYMDFGMSPGMQAAAFHHQQMGTLVEYRNLPGWGVVPGDGEKSNPDEVPPPGYSWLPDGVRCRCVSLWQSGERFACCRGERSQRVQRGGLTFQNGGNE